MMTAPALVTHSVVLHRTLEAPRERVYRAWTDPEALARWFAPSDEFSVTVHHQDLRLGGSFRIEMRHSSGKSHVGLGAYCVIEPPARLAFTWRWEEEPESTDTLVTIDLAPKGEGTELTFRHDLFTTEKAAQDHHQGWSGCLDRLAGLLVTEGTTP